MKRKIFIAYISIFSLIFLLPILQSITGFIPPEKLAGVESSAPLPQTSLKNFKEGSFQKDFEAWFSKIYGLRGYFIRTENQINYSLFNQIDSKLVLGKKNQLYERAYIADYIKRDTLKSEEEIKKFALNLKRLQKHLNKNGTKFIFIITPSKTSIYPEYIPDYYDKFKNRDDTSNYEKLIRYLKKYSIKYLDANAFCIELKKTSKYPLFPKGGTHWNYYTALLFTQKIIKEVELMLGKPLNLLDCEGIKLLDTPFGSDDDIAKLLNIWNNAVFIEKSIHPCVKESESLGAVKPKVLFVGGSFVGNLLYWINQFDVFSHGTEFNRYYRTKIASKKEEIYSKDVIILETNVQAIPMAGFGFIEAVMDSPEFSHEITTKYIPERMRVNEISEIPVTLKNTSCQTWDADDDFRPISVCYHWYDQSGNAVVYGGLRTRIQKDMAPGNSVELTAQVKAPAFPGKYVLKFTMVRERVAWFNKRGAKTLDFQVTVTEK